ncbi:MAG: hypothetical protein KCHDKBKB_03099 [Elusimicrobia bacterium]|nr:hypothetical protein [Elusimicrobiota bacterium]
MNGPPEKKILLTGATGYVGGRLLKLLEKSNANLRCMVRRPENLRGKTKSSTEVIAGDVSDLASLNKALNGIDTAFYLIHSMQEGERFEELERRGAENFARAAGTQGVKRIIYLGGLGDDKKNLSAHLRSRHEVGKILRTFGGICLELRASIVIGSGSLSFEIVRALVERLPVMITPRWVRVQSQPIAISDLLEFLIRAIDLPVQESKIFEIGGRDQVSYADIMKEYAHQRKLRRFMIPVPVLTPHLSGLWLGLVTPVYARIGQTLVKSIEHPTIVQDHSAETMFGIAPMGLKKAIESALNNEDQEFSQTRWCDAMSSTGLQKKWGGDQFGTRIVDSRSLMVSVPRSQAFEPIQKIGGVNGWYFGTILWKLRGYLDLLLGGVGLRRGRRHPSDISVGEALDFWRVEAFEPGKLLRLRAEMKLPGRAWLQFEVEEKGKDSEIRQTALFDPAGIGGLLYWYFLYPFHKIIFSGMLRKIKERAERASQ